MEYYSDRARNEILIHTIYQSGFSRVRDGKCKEIYYKELARAIMEIEKTQDLQSAGCRPRRAGGEAPV
jgi:hypothetical protein